MPEPVLYVFAISHYCEKARWALDYLNIDYVLRHLAPGIHIKFANKLGLPTSSLPILLAGENVLQGSAKIIDWADATAGTEGRNLTPDSAREDCLNIEKRLDDVAGIHARRYYYSEALVEYPKTVRPIFTRDIPFLHKLMVSWKWKVIRGRMMERMDLGRKQGTDSMRILEGELNWLDGLLSDGRKFLAGDQFSRADITAASLLAPLADPKEHPTYANLMLPPRLAVEIGNWKSRPTIGWISDIYAQYR